MSENHINFKAYLHDPNLLEVRRFVVDASAVTNYMFMREKLLTIFPNLRNTSFKITWKDEDDDSITISSDEDLITALTEMKSGLKKLYVYMSGAQENEEMTGIFVMEGQGNRYPSSNVICDICQKSITGYRYKCMQCPDYDLCADCEHKGHHSEHLMVRSSQSDFTIPKCGRKFVNQINRSLRKSGHCRRSFSGPGKCPFGTAAATAAAAAAAAEQQTPAGENCGTSNANASSNSCPFSAENNNNGQEQINAAHFVDMAANLARQHLNPLIETIHNATANHEQASQTPVVNFSDLLAQLMGIPRTPQQETSATPADASTPTVPNTVSTPPSAANPTPTPNPTVLMDTSDYAPKPQHHVTFLDEQPAISDNNKATEPGWTFVPPSGALSSSSSSEASASSVLLAPQSPVETQNVSSQPPSASASVQPNVPLHPDPKIANGLQRLQEMGFSDNKEWLVHLLQMHNGNVGNTVESIINNRFR